MSLPHHKRRLFKSQLPQTFIPKKDALPLPPTKQKDDTEKLVCLGVFYSGRCSVY